MSDKANTILLERAAELIDEFESHPSGADNQLIQAVESGDMDNIHHLVVKFEGELSREHFYNKEIVVW